MDNRLNPIPDNVNILSNIVINSALAVHTELGPGLSEKSYELSLIKELKSRGINAKRQVYLPVRYKDDQIDAYYRIDVLVEGVLVIEVKTVELLLPLHRLQLLSYLKQSGNRLGVLLNFNTSHVRDGIWRVAL
jgi:GxxExxY protein